MRKYIVYRKGFIISLMMKTAVLFTLLLSVIFTGCATKAAQSESTQKGEGVKKEEAANMDYIEKYQLRNELAVDTPSEVSEKRAGVPLGSIQHVVYHSNTCQMDRAFNIWLPSGYDGEKKFPVMYFQHGIFCDENSIIYDEGNRIREIATNLAADGNAKEMVIVFGNMYATTDPKQKPGFDSNSVLPYDNYINELINDLMPYVENHYSVLTGRENTAICGFSMGGRETLFIGLQRPDLFGYVCAIAPAPGLVPGKDWAMTHAGQLSEEQVHFPEGAVPPEVFMVCCGTTDRTVGQFPKSYHKILEANGVNHIWFEVMGADHNSHAVRTGFYQFLTRVFK